MNEPSHLPSLVPPPEPPPAPWKKWLSAAGAIGLLLLNFGAKLKLLLVPLLKFFPVILKSGGSMLLMIGVYSSIWGWRYALGFVVLLLLHECGHLVAAKQFGLKVGAPVFIPFMGAFIALKDAPRNAWVEAWVGIGGPLLGSASALVLHCLGIVWEMPLLIALAWIGYWLNLFNLTPVGQLDGGRIVTAISPWLWIPGVALLGWMAWTRPGNWMVWLILIVSMPRLMSLFRQRTDEEQRFYEIEPAKRWTMGALYFALIGGLIFAMSVADAQLSRARLRKTVDNSGANPVGAPPLVASV